jgi:hypothetical protein
VSVGVGEIHPTLAAHVETSTYRDRSAEHAPASGGRDRVDASLNFAAFVMNTPSHIIHGLWRDPRGDQIRFNELDLWIDPRTTRAAALSDCVHNAGPGRRAIAARLPRIDVLFDVAGERDSELAAGIAREGRGLVLPIAGHRDVAPAIGRVLARGH